MVVVFVFGMIVDVSFPVFVIESSFVPEQRVSWSDGFLPFFPPVNSFVIGNMPAQVILMSLYMSCKAHPKAEYFLTPFDVFLF